MNRLKQHENCIEILEAIERFERFKSDKKYSIFFHSNYFTGMKKKLRHEIEIYEMCIKRLEERYKKQLNKLIKF